MAADVPVGTSSGRLGGTETVLVAEDDPAVLGLIRTLLMTSGYKVLDAANGAEALAIAWDTAGPIDLLVTDVVMPVLGGRDLVERLRASGRTCGSCTRPATSVTRSCGVVGSTRHRRCSTSRLRQTNWRPRFVEPWTRRRQRKPERPGEGVPPAFRIALARARSPGRRRLSSADAG